MEKFLPAFDSKLKIEVNLISEANVQETSTITGTLVSTNTTTPGTTKVSSDFDQALALGKK